MKNLPPIIQVGDVLLSSDILTEMTLVPVRDSVVSRATLGHL